VDKKDGNLIKATKEFNKSLGSKKGGDDKDEKQADKDNKKNEEAEWLNSVRSMLNPEQVEKMYKNWDGVPVPETQREPGPGEVGYAPQQKMGM
jgi:hypothetical protein